MKLYGSYTHDVLLLAHDTGIYRMKGLHMIAFILLVIGGLNWGLVGLGGFFGADWNVVHMIFGAWPTLEWLIYVLVGLAAIWEVVKHKSQCRMCGTGASGQM